MYKVKISVNGIVQEITINANNAFLAQQIVTNMYGQGKVQIIDIRRV